MPRKKNPVKVGEGACLYCQGITAVFVNTRRDLYQRCPDCGRCDQRHDQESQAAMLAGLRARGFEPPHTPRKLVGLPDVPKVAPGAVPVEPVPAADTLGADPVQEPAPAGTPEPDETGAAPEVQPVQQVQEAPPATETPRGGLVAVAIVSLAAGLGLILSAMAGRPGSAT